MPSDVRVEETHVGPVLFPREDTDLVILYLHGNPDSPDPALDMAAPLADLTGAAVVCPRYRATFPAALVDAHLAFRYCQAVGSVVVVVGERLGAALAAALLVQLRDSEATPPRCAVLLSAVLDLSLETKSLRFNASADPLFDISALQRRVADYVQDTSLTDSRLSPLHANVHGLPPVQVLTAGTDPLLDDSLAFAMHAARSRVAVDLRVWPESGSCRAEATSTVAGFIAAHIATPEADTAA